MILSTAAPTSAQDTFCATSHRDGRGSHSRIAAARRCALPPAEQALGSPPSRQPGVRAHESGGQPRKSGGRDQSAATAVTCPAVPREMDPSLRSRSPSVRRPIVVCPHAAALPGLQIRSPYCRAAGERLLRRPRRRHAGVRAAAARRRASSSGGQRRRRQARTASRGSRPDGRPASPCNRNNLCF